MLRKILYGIPKRVLAINIIMTLAWGGMNSFFTIALSKVTASEISHGKFIKAALFFMGFIVLWEITEYICDCCDEMQKAYVRNATYRHYYKKIYFTKPDILQKENTGYIAGILTQLIGKKESMLFSLLLMSIGSFYVIYLIFYIASYSIGFSLIIVLAVTLGITTRLIYSKITVKYMKKMTVVRGEQNRLFMDSIANISTVQKLRGLHFILEKSRFFEKQNLQETKSYTMLNEIGFTVYKFISYMICPVCMFAALYLYEKSPKFPMLEFMAYLSIVTVQLVHNSKCIADFIRDAQQYTVTQKEMDTLVEEQTRNYTMSSIGKEFRDISLKGVNYQYTDANGAVKIVIENFCIHKGEAIGITGESGQGKTTLLKILSGMIESEGTLLVDEKEPGANIDSVYIAQDTEMLDMSLRDNLVMDRDILDDKIVSMIEAVGMKEWYEKQEYGLDTMLGERGVFVSTGQRQRLNLIRGLLIDKEIYLLDEPTSNVDGETEEKMIQLIQESLQGKTVVVVTHKEKICSICNRRYTFENGELHEKFA